jgi:hypothetical protein
VSVTWNYNGTDTLDVAAVGAAGEWYLILCGQDFGGPGFVLVQADGAGAFAGTFSGIVDPGGASDDPGSPNHSFGVEVRHTDSTGTTDIDWFACNIFAYGEASTVGHALAAVWTYDGGQNVSVDIPTVSGLDYKLSYTEFVAGVEVGGSSLVHSGTGVVETIPVAFAFAPDATQGFLTVTVTHPAGVDPSEEWQVANRMFVGGSTTLILGNPAAGTDLILVCVGKAGDSSSRAMTSPDGITWTLITDPDPTGELFGVAYNGTDTVIGCGDAGVLVGTVTSPTSITWNAYATPFSTSGGDAFGVGYSPDLSRWVIGGFAGGVGDETVICTSDDDGVTWTERASPWLAFTDGAFVQEVAWSRTQNLFVAVGTSRSGTIAPFPVVMTSPDGITWTNQVTPMDGGTSVDGVTFDVALGLWIAVGAGATHSIMTSPDGSTWTARFNGGTGAAVVASPTLALATASATWAGGKATATSPDGTTWTAHSTPFDASGAQGVEWSTDLASFAVAAVAHGVYLSPDGVTYTGPFTVSVGFDAQDVCALQALPPPGQRCKGCGSGLLGTVSRT